ncbi:MAG: hypothetical protein RJA70_1285 [Pseudomonadota bacterium]|jgi:signal transduction histidine kinase
MSALQVRILIVDDHQELAENLVEILTECFEGVELTCLATRSRDEALAAAQESAFDLALLDLHLPDGSGLALLAELRKLQPFLQVVIITGDATVESAIGALQEGAFGYVLKPFQVPQLIETVRKAIERAKLLSERDELRQQLVQSERLNREVIDRIPAFVIALDPAGNIVVWNQTLEQVTSYTRDEMLGQPGAHLVDHGGPRRLPLKGGGHRSARWQRASVTHSLGDPPVVYAVGVDVTEESEMQRRAMRAERLAAVGTLAAGLAHEVRNPLNSATLQLQLLERRIKKGKVDETALLHVVDVVKDEIERLNHLVSDFLAFAKPQPVVLVPVDLNELVVSVLRLLQVEAEEVGVVLHSELFVSLGPVPLEPARIRQVLVNLLRNAIQAIGTVGGEVTVRTRPARVDACVELEVEDTGPGFPEDSPIFDAFYTTKDKGTGLGLAIVHRIVSEHDGTINVRSVPGKTVFSIQLPQPASPSVVLPA